MGLETEPFTPEAPDRIVVDDTVLRQPGFRMSEFPLPFSDEERKIGLADLGSHYLGPGLESIGDPRSDGWPGADLKEYDAVSGAEYLRRRGASEAAIAFFDVGQGVLERYSALELFIQVRLGAFDPMVKISGGNDRLPRTMANRLSRHVVYGAPVGRIEQTSDSVTAVARQAGTERRFEADRLVLTVPFTVLRDLELVPEFSAPKAGDPEDGLRGRHAGLPAGGEALLA